MILALGLVFAFTLYFREKKFSEKPRYLTYGLIILRFLSATLIALFLLEPFFKSTTEEVKNPVLIIAQDASSSIDKAHDEQQLEEIRSQIDQLISQNVDKYDIESIHFGSGIKSGLSDSFSFAASNFDQVFQFTRDQFQGLPKVGMVLVSDGIYNLGKNPLYRPDINYPVYSVALGDTLKQSDVAIKNVFYNPIAFLDDSLSILFDVSAYGYSASQSQVFFQEIINGKANTLKKQNLVISSKDYFKSLNFNTLAGKAGTRHFRITVSPLPNERITQNNTRDIFIDVIDSRITVQIVADHPHPDITALRQTLEKNKNYEVSVGFIDKPVDLTEADLVVLHNLPSYNNQAKQVFDEIRQKSIPHLIIMASTTNMAMINNIQDIININGTTGNTNQAQAIVDQDFSAFELDAGTVRELTIMPPLTVPYGEFEIQGNSKTLLRQKIGAVNTNYPLLSFRDSDGLKTALLLGEGIWKWRLNEFGRNGNQNAFDQLIFKTMQYLALKEDKRQWQVKLDKNVWNENERIQFKAILYNDNYEPVNDTEAKLIINNQNGQQFDFLFTRKKDHYVLDAGFLPEGDYRYTATNRTLSETLEYTGNFIVKSLQVELTNLEARHDVLHQLAESTGGNVYYPDNITDLTKELAENKVQSVIFSTERYIGLLNLKWLFFVILVLLSLEWFLRRFHGAY